MRDMFRMIVVLSVLCGLSGFALSYLKMITAPRIEEQVLANVQGPAIKHVFPYAENDPIGERKRFEADGRAFMIFPVRSGGALVGVALEHSSKGYGGDVNIMVGFNLKDDTLAGIGATTLKETPGLGMRIAEPAFTGQFSGQKTPVQLSAGGGVIDGVSGATISSAGAVGAVNNAAAVYARLKKDILAAWAK